MIIQPSREIICGKKQSEYPSPDPNEGQTRSRMSCIGTRTTSYHTNPRGILPLAKPLESNDLFPVFPYKREAWTNVLCMCWASLHPLNTQLWPPHSLHCFRLPFSSSSYSLLRPPLNTTTTTPFANAFSSSKASAPVDSPLINVSNGAATPPFMTAPLSA